MEQTPSRDFVVYKHTSPNGKVYIGLTRQKVERRWRNGKGYSNNEHFSRSIAKYGWDNFSHEILASELTREEAEKMEISLIALYKSNDERYGYNIEGGGEHHDIADSTKEKIRKANIGKKQSPETIRKRMESMEPIRDEWRKNLAAARKPITYSKETRERLREMSIGNQNAVGCHRTEEHKRILRELKSKTVCQYDMSMKLVKVFPSLAEAEKETGISKGNICENIKGRRNHAGGYVWKYQQPNGGNKDGNENLT